jgi:FAD/FMN-containing dehydrogenase
MATDKTHLDSLWKLRESCAVSAGVSGASNYQCDVSLPLAKQYKLVEAMRDRVAPKASTIAYGHLGDQNLHMNIVTENAADVSNVHNLIEPFLYEQLEDVKGSISAEHGIGQIKSGALYYSRDELEVELMKRIKKVFDPKGIMNPYKIFPN